MAGTCLASMIGQQYGNYIVLWTLPERTPERRIQYRCIRLPDLMLVVMTGKALKRTRVRQAYKDQTVKSHPLYKVWQGMRTRCYNGKHEWFSHYGGRGITVCSRWLNFWSFVEDMGERPEGYTLDRIDNDGNYEPSNCKWSSRKEQANNRRPNSGWRKKNVRPVHSEAAA